MQFAVQPPVSSVLMRGSVQLGAHVSIFAGLMYGSVQLHLLRSDFVSHSRRQCEVV